MYNGHPYFSLKNVGKIVPLYMAKYGTLLDSIGPVSYDNFLL